MAGGARRWSDKWIERVNKSWWSRRPNVRAALYGHTNNVDFRSRKMERSEESISELAGFLCSWAPSLLLAYAFLVDRSNWTINVDRGDPVTELRQFSTKKQWPNGRMHPIPVPSALLASRLRSRLGCQKQSGMGDAWTLIWLRICQEAKRVHGWVFHVWLQLSKREQAEDGVLQVGEYEAGGWFC